MNSSGYLQFTGSDNGIKAENISATTGTFSNTLTANGGLTATTGTFSMAEVLAKNLMFTCLQKHYSFEE